MAFSTEGCSARFRPWAALSIFDCGRHFILSTEGGNVHSTVGGILHFRPRAALMFSIQGCNVHSTQGGTVHSTEFCFPEKIPIDLSYTISLPSAALCCVFGKDTLRQFPHPTQVLKGYPAIDSERSCQYDNVERR